MATRSGLALPILSAAMSLPKFRVTGCRCVSILRPVFDHVADQDSAVSAAVGQAPGMRRPLEIGEPAVANLDQRNEARDGVGHLLPVCRADRGGRAPCDRRSHTQCRWTGRCRRQTAPTRRKYASTGSARSSASPSSTKKTLSRPRPDPRLPEPVPEPPGPRLSTADGRRRKRQKPPRRHYGRPEAGRPRHPRGILTFLFPLHLRARTLHRLGPFHHFVFDELAELIGRTTDRLCALRQQLLLDVRHADDR